MNYRHDSKLYKISERMESLKDNVITESREPEDFLGVYKHTKLNKRRWRFMASYVKKFKTKLTKRKARI